MFIGRKQELEGLEKQYHGKNVKLVILYGRRRIGKTEILKQFCKDKEHVFFSCKECTDKSQLKSFSQSLFKENIPAKQYISEFQNWEQTLSSIKALPYKTGKNS